MKTITEFNMSLSTEFGKKLMQIRERAIASGMRLLTEAEVLEEVKRRRGEIEDDETNPYRRECADCRVSRQRPDIQLSEE